MKVQKYKQGYLNSISGKVIPRVGQLLAQLMVIESNLQYMSDYKPYAVAAVVEPELRARLADCRAIARKARKIVAFVSRVSVEGIDVETKS